MLRRLFRFSGRGSLRFLFAKGKLFRSRSLAARVAANPQRQDSRIAVVVAKKILKSAPKRNRVRRRIYEIVRLNWQHIAPGHDIVLTVYDPSFFEMSPKQVEEQVVEVLQKAGVWSAKQ